MEAQVICPSWGKPVRRLLEDDSARAVAVYSPRAAGKYRLTSSSHAVLANLTPAQKVSITSWVVAQHKAGIPVPEITSYNLDAVKSRRRLSFSARVDAALELLAARRPTLDAEFVINPQANPDEEAELLMAVSETETTSELRRLLIIMKDMGILDANLTGHARFTISAGGWGRVDKLMERNESSPRAFIAMWFDASTTGA